MTETEELIAEDGTDRGPKIDLEKISASASSAVYEAIQNASNNTDRSKQAQDHFMGISTLGHCRQFATLMTRQTPPSDVRDKTPAFFGTVAGDAIETQLRKDHPTWLIQGEVEFPVRGGGGIPGHLDIAIPFEGSATYEEFLASLEEGYEGEPVYMQGVWDLKSKAELDSIRIYGPSQQQIFQIHAYAKALIEQGVLNPEYPIILGDVFFDRSGRNQQPYSVFHVYSEDVVEQISDWIDDVKYAVIHGEDASRDMPREWCWSYCEYATICRGSDTDVEGLIEDPEFLAGTQLIREAIDLEKEAKRLKASGKTAIAGRSGSTGEFNVRQTVVEPTFIEGYMRKGYTKTDVTPVPGARKKKETK